MIYSFDGSMINGLQSVSHWQTYFGTPTGAMLGFFNAAYPLGGILGTFLISPAADTFGRRWGLATGAALCCISAAIQGAAINIAIFIISRVIISAGSVVIARVGAPYITEIAHPAQRKSPRWLVSKGRNDKALQMLTKYHSEGDSSNPVIQFEYNEILETLSAEASEHNNIIVFLKDLGSTPGNCRRMFIMFSAIYFATLPAKVSRCKLFLWSLAAIWVINICITAGSPVFAKDNTNKAAAYTVVAFLYLFSPAYNLSFNSNLSLYIPEILPYRMRTKGLSFFYFVQFCFIMLSTFIVPIGLRDITWKFYIIFIGWVMVKFVGVYLVFPETKGPSLEEIAWIFNGPNSGVNVRSARVEGKHSAIIEHIDGKESV
ncbi:hypothetical protein H9Q69_011858 [Fusarium xylarioides]|nr:hypothetical protein H9Q69_011858 [Fusarium xylarioides]